MTKGARIHNGEKTVSLASGVGKPGQQLYINEVIPHNRYFKINRFIPEFRITHNSLLSIPPKSFPAEKITALFSCCDQNLGSHHWGLSCSPISNYDVLLSLLPHSTMHFTFFISSVTPLLNHFYPLSTPLQWLAIFASFHFAF